MADTLSTLFPYRRPAELGGAGGPHRQVIIVGAGPVGLTLALDWASRGHDVLLLAASDTTAEGSRAICFAKRTLEICDRLGFGDAVIAKGVSWNVGKVFYQDDLLYEFNLLSEPGHQRPAFVNLQQYHFERFQLQALAALAHAAVPSASVVDLRFANRVVSVSQRGDRVDVTVQCPDGVYALSCDWLIACDGASSPVRKILGLSAAGQVFRDRFLIADVKMHGDSSSFRNERWFWFDPPFHRNQSALLHRQADNVWRLDFQLGWNADPEAEKKPERVLLRIRAMLGDDVEFSLEWVSVYTFQCRRMGRFVHDRVIFAGDAAHQVSPFGARGANSGVQDADNLGWKLDLVIRGLADRRLLDTYDAERAAAADENLLNSTRSTDFITPKTDISRTFRDATLELAAKYPFARKLVNSGRLSVPTHYRESVLNTPDAEVWTGPAAAALAPGSPALDAPVSSVKPAGDRTLRAPGWLLQYIGGGFTIVVFAADANASGGNAGAARTSPSTLNVSAAVGSDTRTDVPANIAAAVQPLRLQPIAFRVVLVMRRKSAMVDGITLLIDADGHAFARYAPEGAAVYLFRPDQHVAGRRAGVALDWIPAALRRAFLYDDSLPNGGADGNAQHRAEPVTAG